MLDLILISRVIPKRPRYLPIFLKPLMASILMGGAAWAVHGLLDGLLGNSIATLLAIFAAVVLYLVLVIYLRAISKDDLALMPKGDKIARLLKL